MDVVHETVQKVAMEAAPSTPSHDYTNEFDSNVQPLPWVTATPEGSPMHSPRYGAEPPLPLALYFALPPCAQPNCATVPAASEWIAPLNIQLEKACKQRPSYSTDASSGTDSDGSSPMDLNKHGTDYGSVPGVAAPGMMMVAAPGSNGTLPAPNAQAPLIPVPAALPSDMVSVPNVLRANVAGNTSPPVPQVLIPVPVPVAAIPPGAMGCPGSTSWFAMAGTCPSFVPATAPVAAVSGANNVPVPMTSPGWEPAMAGAAATPASCLPTNFGSPAEPAAAGTGPGMAEGPASSMVAMIGTCPGGMTTVAAPVPGAMIPVMQSPMYGGTAFVSMPGPAVGLGVVPPAASTVLPPVLPSVLPVAGSAQAGFAAPHLPPDNFVLAKNETSEQGTFPGRYSKFGGKSRVSLKPREDITSKPVDIGAESQDCETLMQIGDQTGPPFGTLHKFHDETGSMGDLSANCREFTKTQFRGRLSLVTEDEIHTSGVLKYCMQFTEGELSSADGLGFVFGTVLPCPKNIQKIVSIFVNRAGRICMRAHSEVKRSDVGVKRLELGDWVSVTVDLEEQVATFTVWPKRGNTKPSAASFAFGHILAELNAKLPKKHTIPVAGHFACVIKNDGMRVTLGS